MLQQPVQWDLTYDAADQITSVATTNPLNSLLLHTQTHTVDPAGNMTAENGGSVLGHLGTFTFARQFNQLNQLTGITAPHARTFSYDPEGNTLSDGQREYAWDGENRMIELILNEDQFTRFFYDGLNRCVKIEEWSDGELEEVRHIIWDGLERVERKNAALQTVRRYFAHGFQTVNGGTTTKYFYNKDHLGSIRTVTNLAGQTVETLSYDPWGRRQNSTGTPLTDFGYTGHYTHSQSNLVLAPYRTYDPQTTRWLSRDPIAESGGINLYGYVGNNPINYWDPLGLQRGRKGWTPPRNRGWRDPGSVNTSEGVWIGRRPAQIPGGSVLANMGIYHQWIITPEGEFGLGPEGEEGAPGSPTDCADVYPKTSVNDHAGEQHQPDVQVKRISGLHPSQVKPNIQPGPTGKRWPCYNCNTWVDETIRQSRPPRHRPNRRNG